MTLVDNLVSYWKLDESSGNASDSVGSVTLTNTDVTYSAVKINNGAVFNGSSAKLAGTVTGRATFSVSGWFNSTTLRNEDTIWQVRPAANNANYALQVLYTSGSTYKVRLLSYNGSTTNTIDSTTSLNINTIYHFVCIVNGSSSILYINGSSDGTGTLQTHTSGTDFYLGVNATTNYLTGKIDEVGIWSRTLSSDEATALYNSGNGKQYPFTVIYTLIAEVGQFTLTGVNTTITKFLNLVAETGQFALTGINILIGRVYDMCLSVGQFILSGKDIILKKTGWTNTTKSSSWSNSTKNTSSFTNKDKTSSSWTNTTKN